MESKKIFVADGLLNRYPLICKKIYEVCEKEKVEFDILSGVNNIWIRDYMPIPIDDGKYVKFRYTANCNKYPVLTPTLMSLCWSSSIPFPNIYLDGGNFVRRENIVFITEKLIKDNPEFDIYHFEKVLQVLLYVIPVEPGDTLGHADGILNFAPDGSIFINDYTVMKSKRYDDYLADVIRIVENDAGFSWELFPFAYHKKPKITERQFRKKYPYADEFNPGYGYYINYLQIGKTIILPVFGIEEDQMAMKMFPNLNVEPVDCSDLSMEGGLIHCVTWENYR